MAVDWGYYDKFLALEDKYLPERGEGETKATQIITALTKLIYKWYNDGDVFDNTHHLQGWANDLSSYANWLWEYTDAHNILDKIAYCYTESDYENLLKELADKLYNEDFLAKMNEIYKESDLPELKARAAFGGSDAAYTTNAGIPTVDNLGTEGDRLHSVEEFIYLKSLVESAKKIAAVCYGI